jgi:nucleoid-associated protein YgaU
MGNFEKLSVLVIVVIIVMILVVALYTWTDNPETTPESAPAAEASPGTGAAPGPGTGNNLLGANRKPPAPDEWTKLPDPFRDPSKTDPAGPSEREKSLQARAADGKDASGGRNAAKPHDANPAPTVVEDVVYVVKSGDSYGKIAQEQLGSYKHWPEIEKLNGIPPERLREKMTLKLPRVGILALAKGQPANGSGSKATPRAEPAETVVAGGTYTVKSGDTIESIAKKILKNPDRWTDIWLENLDRLEDPRAIAANMTLKIPAR